MQEAEERNETKRNMSNHSKLKAQLKPNETSQEARGGVAFREWEKILEVMLSYASLKSYR
jgi:hypothetical protein